MKQRAVEANFKNKATILDIAIKEAHADARRAALLATDMLDKRGNALKLLPH
jgi:hypothetical protein